MNLLSQLQAASSVAVPLPERKHGSKPGINNPRFQNSLKAYGAVMRGAGPLTTPQIAARMGYGGASCILRVLNRMAEHGVIRCIGHAPRQKGRGPASRLWVWLDVAVQQCPERDG